MAIVCTESLDLSIIVMQAVSLYWGNWFVDHHDSKLTFGAQHGDEKGHTEMSGY